MLSAVPPDISDDLDFADLDCCRVTLTDSPTSPVPALVFGDAERSSSVLSSSSFGDGTIDYGKVRSSIDQGPWSPLDRSMRSVRNSFEGVSSKLCCCLCCCSSIQRVEV